MGVSSTKLQKLAEIITIRALFWYLCTAMNTYTLAIFDLDGTLLNTIGDLSVCCNHILAQEGLPTHTYEQYCNFVGNGVKRLVERSIPEELRSTEYVEMMRRRFVAYYYEHIDTHTTPYDGISELLAELQQRGIMLAVASNKFQAGVERLIQRFFPDIEWQVVLGGREGVPAKPSPDIALEIIEKCGAKPSETLFIGDSGVDIQTAYASGATSVGCAWGFRSLDELLENRAHHIVHRPSEIIEVIRK